MKKTLFLLAILAAILWGTNPGMEDFEAFLEQRSKEQISEKVGGGVVGRVLGGAGAGLLAANADGVTNRTSYLVASTYDVDPDGDDVAEYRFLGIGSQFITLRKPE